MARAVPPRALDYIVRLSLRLPSRRGFPRERPPYVEPQKLPPGVNILLAAEWVFWLGLGLTALLGAIAHC
jgi:hypothetical protein